MTYRFAIFSRPILGGGRLRGPDSSIFEFRVFDLFAHCLFLKRAFIALWPERARDIGTEYRNPWHQEWFGRHFHSGGAAGLDDLYVVMCLKP